MLRPHLVVEPGKLEPRESERGLQSVWHSSKTEDTEGLPIKEQGPPTAQWEGVALEQSRLGHSGKDPQSSRAEENAKTGFLKPRTW